MKDQLVKWGKENSMIVVLLGLFFLMPYVLRSIDETAAAFDAGILHSIIFCCVVYAIFQACTWSVVKVIWPDIGNYLRLDFSSDFSKLDKKTKVYLSICVYFIILLSFIFLLCAVL